MHDLGQQAVNAEITVALRGKALPVGHWFLGLPTAFKQQIPFICVFFVVLVRNIRSNATQTALLGQSLSNVFVSILHVRMPSFYWHGFSLRGKHWLQFFVIPIPHLHLR
ncbi:hypothetical protein T07_11886 [Trichinella nelsoni]|uniref:Uncharacterized protein n=1 Tax=Trichinella nelsoni TaxID=6336 RepID=A0A0V0SEK4_9BILA|nr:hypothetical protein T07_11886 [Trichinella nelsoni]